jgi:AcrR family transcriptional regulator
MLFLVSSTGADYRLLLNPQSIEREVGVTAPPRRRKAPEVRRQEILDAATSLSIERGSASISVRDVAERASVAPGLIHHYFPSLDALITESFGSWADEILTRLRQQAEGVSPRTGLALVVTNLTPEERIWNDALTTSSRFSQLNQRARELSIEYLAHVESLIRAGIDEGVFRCDDPTLAAWRLILMLDGLVAMVHIIKIIEPSQIPLIVGPVVEEQLQLEPGSFTELVQAISSGLAAAKT